MENVTFDRLMKLVGRTAWRRGGLRAALSALLVLGGGQALEPEQDDRGGTMYLPVVDQASQRV